MMDNKAFRQRVPIEVDFIIVDEETKDWLIITKPILLLITIYD